MGRLAAQRAGEFWADESGEVTVGYLLIIALVSIPVIFGMVVAANEFLEIEQARESTVWNRAEVLFEKAGSASR